MYLTQAQRREVQDLCANLPIVYMWKTIQIWIRVMLRRPPPLNALQSQELMRLCFDLCVRWLGPQYLITTPKYRSKVLYKKLFGNPLPKTTRAALQIRIFLDILKCRI